MLLLTLLFAATLFLAYSNGANDNFKGVATLFGSGTTNYRQAVGWATVTTFAGSVCSIFLAQTLVKNFSGKGLVPDALTASPNFLLSVALAAGLTVIIATVASFPVSTTHGLTGALAGAGLVAVGSQVNFSTLGGSFFAPLLLSPVVALVLGSAAYALAHAVRRFSGVTKEWCVCVGETRTAYAMTEPASFFGTPTLSLPNVCVDSAESCHQRYAGGMLGVSAQGILDSAHFLSAGSVCFARGLNDTPKIVALLLVVKALELEWGMVAVAAGMAVGGLVNSRRVADTMSRKITPMTPSQGFTANFVTAGLVVFASRLGLPVSTTHVSCGALFGIGAVTRRAEWGTIAKILVAWVTTLPLGAALGAVSFGVIVRL
jgi:PiT family inorganic phosphate transporter